MKTRRTIQSLILVLALALPMLGQSNGTKDSSVSVVTGESWLSHLHRDLGQTSMGSTGRWGPVALTPQEPSLHQIASVPGSYSSGTVTLHGEDLYRMNCRACHGEAGQGAPPEINSVINPVRATSVPLIMERMKNAGMDITRPAAAELAKQSNAALLQRLHQGGQDMPAFPQLTDAEIRALLAYLGQLAGLPGAEKQQLTVKETPVQVGEHIVKSTCHICHGASGENPDAQRLLNGAIPPLGSLTSRVSRTDLVRKVTSGAPIEMGQPAAVYRGRMPVFYYLTPDEAADVYLYLSLYPPNQAAEQEMAAASIAPAISEPPASAGAGRPQDVAPKSDDNFANALLSLSAAGLLAFILLALGLSFTMREMKKLSGSAEEQPVIEPALAPLNITVVGGELQKAG